MHVLIIEDDQRLAKIMARVLEKEHFTVDLAHDGITGLEFALTGTHDVAVVDWMLPGKDGPSICKAVREAKVRLPLLMLTARDQVEDRVAGLYSGADDYLTKPFAIEELLARIHALSRRFDVSAADASTLTVNELILDLRAHTATRTGTPLDLTITEWNLLEYLMRNRGQTLTREQIFNRVWAYDSDAQIKMVDIYVSYLRKKLKTSADLPDPIETVRGVGYRLP
jgi:two-component system OmpR family response regulator